jgi:Tol biopolymer transport system component
MELVDGKALNELIPRKGMRLTDALRIAAQVAGALTAAHAAGIVHRDLKPANIMVDAHGRVKVLDFGLAKLSAPAATTAGADETTCTLAVDQPVSEEGVVFGSVPYMSPEQAEGKPVDERSDIFSFGAVLYEMITGQRAFRGESRASTLAAIVEKDPPPVTEISATTPPELERVISRCLRKEVNRRSQNMADVKLALEELRDESESGKLARPAAAVDAGARRWLWPAVATAGLLLAAAAFTWTYLNLRGSQSKGPELVRVSPDDGHIYNQPAISPDGEFVAYVSDRSGKRELWLQQVGGGDPIQLTHSGEQVNSPAFFSPAFFPDGKRILYGATSADYSKRVLEVIPALGGDPHVLIQGWGPELSPDGRQIAYFESNQNRTRLMTISSSGGQPRELPAWAHMKDWGGAAWTPDNRYLLCLMSMKPEARDTADSDWFIFPVDGSNPVATGVGDALRAAGLTISRPGLVTGDRALFLGGPAGRRNTWEIRLSPGSWRVQGVPRQLTFGTQPEGPVSISATGTVALEVGSGSSNLHLIPLSAATGQPTGAVRPLTQGGSYKNFVRDLWGDPGSAYYEVFMNTTLLVYAVHLDSGKRTLVSTETVGTGLSISPDGRQVAYSVAEGDSYSIRVGDAGTDSAGARVVCKACGAAEGFSPDGRFLFYCPEAKLNSKAKLTVRLLEVSSGKDRPLLEHPTESVFVGRLFGQDSGWVQIELAAPGSWSFSRRYVVPYRAEPVPQREWIKIPLPDGSESDTWRVSPVSNFFYFFEGSKLMAARFDPQRASFNEPREIKFVPGSDVTLTADDDWMVRGPGLVFSHRETSGSVWLMKLPR